MRKKLLLVMALIGLIFTTSCQDELSYNAGDQAMVEFTISTPEIATRAYSDGQSATVLEYAVYKEDGTILGDLTKAKTLNNATTINGSTTVNLKLTTGNTYTVVFWAADDADNVPYVVDFGSKLDEAEMKVSYSNALSNDEGRDAFYACKEIKVTGAMTETIQLKRPFAQLNIGTSDYTASANAGYEPVKSAVKVRKIYDTLRLADGAVSGEVEANFEMAEIKKDERFPVDGYQYLAMNYLLVKKDVVDVEFRYTDGSNEKTRIVGSVPLERNYRTNIYGQLLTSDVDINVEIVPEYNEPDHEAEELYIAAACGGEVTLTEDVELKSNLVFTADAVINLNGYTLTGGKKFVDGQTSGTDMSAITVDGGANVVIQGEGTIKGAEYGVYLKDGVLTIKGGNINANLTAVQIAKGDLHIEGGKFSIADDKDYTINCINSYWYNGLAKIHISGGEYYGFNPANSFSEGSTPVNFCKDGYTTVEKDGWYYVVAEEIGTVVTNADELREAIKNAQAGDGIKVMPGTYEGLFNLTGKNLTLTGNATIKGMIWADQCKVTVKGLTLTNPDGVQHPNTQNSQYYTSINNQYPLVGAYNNANIRFEDCKFDIVGPTVYGFYGYAHNNPTFKNCTFNCNGIRPIANNGDSIVVDGCTFIDQYHYSVRIFENAGKKQTVIYTNNVVTGTNTKGEFEGVNISKKGDRAVVLGDFTIKGNTQSLKYRHHQKVTMSDNCTYNTDIANFAFEKEN